MKVISFVSQKGGSGKTTLAVSCAVAAQSAGQKVVIFDMDPQASAEAWYQTREEETPNLVRVTSQQLEEAVTRAEGAGFELIFIDTAGRDEPTTAAAIRASDLCIIPCRPTPADMKATPATIATINRLEKAAAAFVLSQTPARGYRIREAEHGLRVLGLVAPAKTVLRNAYQDAFGSGMGVTEFEPEGKAAAEIREIWTWIEKKLSKVGQNAKAA